MTQHHHALHDPDYPERKWPQRQRLGFLLAVGTAFWIIIAAIIKEVLQ